MTGHGSIEAFVRSRGVEEGDEGSSELDSSGMRSSDAEKKEFAFCLSEERDEARGKAARGFRDGSV